MRKYGPLTPEERAEIIALYGNTSIKEIMRRVGRSPESIRTCAKAAGLTASRHPSPARSPIPKPPRGWTKATVKWAREHQTTDAEARYIMRHLQQPDGVAKGVAI